MAQLGPSTNHVCLFILPFFFPPKRYFLILDLLSSTTQILRTELELTHRFINRRVALLIDMCQGKRSGLGCNKRLSRSIT